MALRRGHPIVGRHFDLIVDTQRYVGRTLFLRRIPHRRFISGTWRYAWSSRAAPPPVAPAAVAGRQTARPRGRRHGSFDQGAKPDPDPGSCARGPRAIAAGAGLCRAVAGRRQQGTGKCWPLEAYIAVARRQVERGRVPVFLLGPEETRLDEPARGGAGGVVSRSAARPAARSADRRLTAALGERLAAAVANCSGAGHLLAAGGAPMVSLFGPTRPEKYAPFSRALICLKAQDYGADDRRDPARRGGRGRRAAGGGPAPRRHGHQ